MTLEEIASLGKGIACDSRQVQPGDIFVAIPCANIDKHIQQAVDQGASIVVTETNAANRWKNIKTISTLNPRLMLAKLAKVFYSSQPQNTVAVTGTNGKSSVVHLTRQLWEGCEHPAASLGTLGLISQQPTIPNGFRDMGSKIRGEHWSVANYMKRGASAIFEGQISKDEGYNLQLPSLTTLDPISLHKTLNHLSKQHIKYFAFEASSHGLDQYRLHAVELKAAGFTNLTQDHLDYHQTMEDYFLAKSKLFTEVLPQGATAVLNKDSIFFERLQTLCHQRSQTILTYSLTQRADLTVQSISQHTNFLEFDLSIKDQIYSQQKVNLVGRFQLENLLCGLGLAIATGAPIDSLIKTLPSLSAVKGRMQLVGNFKGAYVFIDYAHTPDALKTTLMNLRPHTQRKLWVVFGCGGNRDALKRPQMGAIACEYADQVIVTDDNPRYEEPALIREQILAACLKAIEISDRRQAIRSTIAQLKEGDIVLIAGKGHETGQIVGDTTYPFDDQIEVETFLKECINV